MILPNSVTGRDEMNELDEIHLLISGVFAELTNL